MRTVISLFLKDQYIDKTIMEELIEKSDIKWEIIRPGMLTDGNATSSFKILTELQKGMEVGKISRADVADFLINEVIHYIDSNYRTNKERVIFGWEAAAYYISELILEKNIPWEVYSKNEFEKELTEKNIVLKFE